MEPKTGIIARISGWLAGPGSMSRDSFTIFFTDTIVILIGLAASIVMARLFGPSGRGIITMVTLIPVTLSYFGSLGLPDSSAYFLSRFPDQARENFFSIQLLSWIFGIITVAAAYLTFPYWYKYYQSYPKDLFMIALPVALLTTLVITLRFSLLGLGSTRNFNLMNTAQALGSLLAVFVAGVFLKQNLRWYCAFFLIYMGLIVLLGLYLNLKRPELRGWPKKLSLKPLISYSARIYPVGLAQILQGRIDYFLIGYFMKPKELGIYSIAVLISENLLRITAAFQMALFPRVSADWTDQKFVLAARVLRVNNLINIVLSLALIAVGYPLILVLFGRAFLPAFLPLVILLLARLPEGFYKITAYTISGLGRPGLSSSFGAMGVIAGGVLGWILIPRFGLVGASLAKVISSFVQFVPALFFFSRYSKMSLSQCLMINREDYDLLKQKWSNVAKQI
jgi:O-antigen/teichoic acid export membrane protein